MRRVRALLAILLAHEGRPVSAARLIDNLWGENLRGDPVALALEGLTGAAGLSGDYAMSARLRRGAAP